MFESKINRGKVNGYAPLDGSGKVPLDKLPPIQSTIDTGSFATTASLQSLIDVTGSFATTGSNQFYGDQSISGSLNVSSSLVVSSTFVNDSNIQLSGSDLIIEDGNLSVSGTIDVSGSLNVTNTFVNRGTIDLYQSDLIIDSGSIIVTGSIYADNLVGLISSSAQITEFGFATTGSNTFTGTTSFATVGEDAGGEIRFGVPQTNTTLENCVTTDVFQNRLRIFEGSSNAKGVYIDLSKAPNQVGAELMWKASGFVNTDVDVTLGNIKARIPSSGNKTLQLSTVSGTYSVYGSGVYSYNGIGGATIASSVTITTTPTYIAPGYTFVVAGATDTWTLMDTSAGICWRITMIIGSGFLNNFISIERLH